MFITILVYFLILVIFAMAGAFMCVMIDIAFDAIRDKEWSFFIGAIMLFIIDAFCLCLVISCAEMFI